MCGIIGYYGNSKDCLHIIEKGVSLIKNRGPDGIGISNGKKVFFSKKKGDFSVLNNFKNSKLIFVHLLLAINNHIPQPILYKNLMLTYNGEIYNWMELCVKYKIKAENDSELLIKLITKKGIKIIDELDGVFAFVLFDKEKNKIFLCRDKIGVKPLFYIFDKEKNNFIFASEKKALLYYSEKVIEVNPRNIIEYDIKNKKLNLKYTGFYELKNNKEKKKLNEKQTASKVKKLISNAVRKRLSDKKIGVLFSGGIDSTIIAHELQKQNINFIAYVVGSETSADVIESKKIAKEMNFPLKIIDVDENILKKNVKKIINLIEDSNVVKVEVALTLYLAMKEAKKDKVRVMYSGLGSEEVFAGYERHLESLDVNEECLSGLRFMYYRDLYRDDVISMENHMEVRFPFLDKEVVTYALTIDPELKIKGEYKKYILRKAYEKLSVAWRKKKAAQYGSKVDKLFKKITKKLKITRSQYFNKFLGKPNLRVGALVSSGKDGWYSAFILKRQFYDISCLMTIYSENKESYMFHIPAIEMVEHQSHASEIPLVKQKTKGVKEDELKDLKKLFQKAKKKHNIQAISTGAIFSNYQRKRIEDLADRSGLIVLSPLWHKDQETELKELLYFDFKIMVASIHAYPLTKKYVGKIINKKFIEEMKKIHNKIKINVAGEGGEYETLVLDCPLFKKEINIKDYNIHKDQEHSASLIINKIELKEKR